MSLHAETVRRLDEENIEFLLLQFVDLTGAAKGKLVPRATFDAVASGGVGFAGAAVRGLGQGPHSPDVIAIPDLRTYSRLPWKPNTVRFACSLSVDGRPHPWCSRARLERSLSRLADRGMRLNVGFEPEFFLVRRRRWRIEPWDPCGVDTLDKPAYDVRSMSPAMDYLQSIFDALGELGWDAYQADHEDANSQFEINFGYCDALQAADRVVFFRLLAAELAKPLGATATFMPKPFADLTGSGLHAHLHVADGDGTNLFIDENDERRLGCSPLAYAYIEAALRHAPGLCALTSPTVNCYKRLGPNAHTPPTRSGQSWSPFSATFGGNNRSHMIRIAGPGNLEDRSVSSACNPYLALIAYARLAELAADTPAAATEPNHANAYEQPDLPPLPATLAHAVSALEQDGELTDALGELAAEFVSLKSAEWLASHGHISSWERSRYLTAL
ncbi:MAG: glutamine synthetase beta-grasp domain-containing protein [Phycisphaerales bacterium JB060]